MNHETTPKTPEQALSDYLDRLEADINAGRRSLTSVLAQVYLAGADHGRQLGAKKIQR